MDYPKELRELRKLFPAIKKFQTTPSPLTKRILSLKKDLRSIMIFQQNPSISFSSLFWTYWIPKNNPLSIDPHPKSRRKHTKEHTKRQDIWHKMDFQTFRNFQLIPSKKTSFPRFWGTFPPLSPGWKPAPRHESRNYDTPLQPLVVPSFQPKLLRNDPRRKNGWRGKRLPHVILMNRFSGLRC